MMTILEKAIDLKKTKLKKGNHPAVFIDRDGTLNIEKDYLYKVEDFEFIAGASAAIKALRQAGYLVIVVTNQSGIARGYYTLQDVNDLHHYIQAELASADTAIDAFYVCPHHPTAGRGGYGRQCDCRKGAPGMLLQAAQEHNIDLARSFMVGDKISDIEAAENAGCRPVMVQSGYGRSESRKLSKGRAFVCDDIAAAVSHILTVDDSFSSEN